LLLLGLLVVVADFTSTLLLLLLLLLLAAGDGDDPLFDCKLLEGGEWPLPLLESLPGGVKFCGFRLLRICFSWSLKKGQSSFTSLHMCRAK